MGVTGIHKCDFVVYTLNDFVIIPITFDDEFWHSLLQKLSDFYTAHVLPAVWSLKDNNP